MNKDNYVDNPMDSIIHEEKVAEQSREEEKASHYNEDTNNG